MAKTPEYQRKATRKYYEKHDVITITCPKGTKKRIQDLNIKPREIVLEALNIIEKREKEQQEKLVKDITLNAADQDEFFPFT